MNGKRISISIVAVAAVAAGITASTVGSSGQGDWQTALNARSEALNKQYGLGEHGRSELGATAPGWLQALEARSDALNRRYGLGEYARSTTGGNTPSWIDALMARSEALNRHYGLGAYARSSSGASTPDWTTALMARSEALNRQYGLGEYARSTTGRAAAALVGPDDRAGTHGAGAEPGQASLIAVIEQRAPGSFERTPARAGTPATHAPEVIDDWFRDVAVVPAA